MRADRLVNIMILLQNKGKMTTRELAGTLEVSHRTILRDMDALSASGIPIFAVRGKAGGWRLMDHFRSQLSGMKLADMKSLFILPSEKILEDLGVAAQGLDIREKLLASMPGSIKDEAQSYLDKIYIDAGTWKSSPSTEKPVAFQIVQQAVWEERKLNMLYEKTDGLQTRRVVLPLGMVAKGTTWYLVAVSDRDDVYRSYRISRILEAHIEPETFTRPENFSLAGFWKQSKIDFTQKLPAYIVKVLAHRSIIRRMTFTSKFVQHVHSEESREDHWVPVTLCFNAEQEAVEYVLGFGEKIKLIYPEHLIGKIVQQALAVVDIYESADEQRSTLHPEDGNSKEHDRKSYSE